MPLSRTNKESPIRLGLIRFVSQLTGSHLYKAVSGGEGGGVKGEKKVGTVRLRRIPTYTLFIFLYIIFVMVRLGPYIID